MSLLGIFISLPFFPSFILLFSSKIVSILIYLYFKLDSFLQFIYLYNLYNLDKKGIKVLYVFYLSGLYGTIIFYGHSFFLH